MQAGSYDCGLFAIAFAAAVAFDLDPVKCFFNQKRMRRHLYGCFLSRKLIPFPERKRPYSKRAVIHDNIEVHCYCRMPELKDVPMIECSLCFKRYHLMCDNECLNESDTEWSCQQCQFMFYNDV